MANVVAANLKQILPEPIRTTVRVEQGVNVTYPQKDRIKRTCCPFLRAGLCCSISGQTNLTPGSCFVEYCAVRYRS